MRWSANITRQGFFKYKNRCRNKHDYRTCEESNCDRSKCTKRHPQECKRFIISMGCRFKERCAYTHKEKRNSTYQCEVNSAVASVSVKHENEINLLKEEMENTRLIITNFEK